MRPFGMSRMAVLAAAAALTLAPAETRLVQPAPIEIQSPRQKSMTERQKRKIRMREEEQMRQRRAFRVWSENDRARRQEQADRFSLQGVVNRMTNWQRTKWAQAGYPGLEKHEVHRAEPFAVLSRT